MPSNDKLTRNELLLPNIILYNQMFVETQRINRRNKKSEARKRPVNFQATTDPVCTCKWHEESESKRNRNPDSRLQYPTYLRNSLEYVNIVDHAPFEMKFLSRTEIREPHTEEMAQARSAAPEVLGMEQDSTKSKAQQSFTTGWEFAREKCIDEFAVVPRTARASISLQRIRNQEGKGHSAPPEKENKRWRASQGKCFYLDKQNSEKNEECSNAKKVSSENQKTASDKCDLLFQFTAKRMDIAERDGAWQKREINISPSRKYRKGYEISIDLLKPKRCNGRSNEEKDQQGNDVKQKACLRFDQRLKIGAKETTHRNLERTIKSGKIRLYPFYEAMWENGKIGDKEYDNVLTKEAKPSSKIDAMQFISFEKSLVNTENPSNSNEHLKISTLQLTPKSFSVDKCRTDAKVHAKEKREENSSRNATNTTCSPSLKSHLDEDTDQRNECSDDLANLLMVNSSSLRDTVTLLARITASSLMLTDKQILKLIDGGNLRIKNFLIIKRILLSMNAHEYASVARESQPHKEAAPLLFAVLGFIDRCEKVLKQANRTSSLENYEKNYAAEVDCTKRGIVIGKMPAISVMSYNHNCDLQIDNREDLAKAKRRKKDKKIELLKAKEFLATKGNEEEQLQKNPVSVASLRGNILVRSMDLQLNNHWEKSYLIKKRYMPKRPKKKPLKSFPRPFRKKHAPPATVSKQLVNTNNYTQPATTPSSRNSISTCFQSDELQDVHIPTEQSIVHLLSRNVSDRSLELSSDGKQDECLSENDPSIVSKDAYRKIKDEDIDLQKLQAAKPTPHKICEFLKGKVQSKLQESFNLYPKIYRLMSSLHSKTDDPIDVRAARELQTDFKSHFKLIEENRYMMYCKAFAKVDQENNEYILVEMIKSAIKFVDSIASCPEKYIDYTLMVLDMLVLSKITIKMFCIICGVLERMWEGGTVIQDAVETLEFLTSEGKMMWYKDMYYESSELDKNHISLETVKLELFAGGMNAEEEREISDKIVSREDQRISYLDFIAYIPLFIAIHDKICANAFE